MTNPHTPPPTCRILEGVHNNAPSHRERDEHYAHVIATPAPRWRIIMCRDRMQWIVQKKEASHAGPWRAEGYYTCRESLIKACGKLDSLADTNTEAVLHALPERIARAST